MKTIATGILFSLCLVLPLAAQSITVTSPAGGEIWVIGATHTISWTHSGFSDPAQETVRIVLRDGNNVICLIQENVPLIQLSYAWNSSLCTGLQPGTYYIRVRTAGSAATPPVIGDSNPMQMVTIKAPLSEKPELTPGKTLLPDLVVANCGINPQHPAQGDKVRFQAALRNNGPAASVKAFDCLVKVFGPQGFMPVEKTFRIRPLPAGDTENVFLDYTCTHWGAVRVEVKLDEKNEINESDESNNQKNFHHSVNPLPDLVVCLGTPVGVDIGTTKKVWVSVVNRGPADAPPSRLRWYVEQNDVKWINVPRLAQGEEKVFYRDVRFSTKGNKEMTAVIDPENKVRELNENNNRVEGLAISSLLSEFAPAGVTTKKCSDGGQ